MRRRSLFDHLRPPRGFHLTKSGWIFFVFLIGIILAAMLTGNNLLFIILAFMLAFMIVSGLESERNLRHLEIARIIPAEVYAGTEARIGYHIRNRRNESLRLVIKDLEELHVDYLARGQGEMVSCAVVFPRRGGLTLGAVKIATTYPYGLFEKSLVLPTRDDLTVFPRPVECSALRVRGSEGNGSGQDQDSISHVKGYQPGDTMSSIVWKKQHLGLVSRVVEGGSGTSGIIVLVPGGELEEKLGQAAFLIRELFARGVGFGLVHNEYFSGLGSSRQHKRDILTRLAGAVAVGEPLREHLNGSANLIEI